MEKIPVVQCENHPSHYEVDNQTFFELIIREYQKVCDIFNPVLKDVKTKEERDTLRMAQTVALATGIGDSIQGLAQEEDKTWFLEALAPALVHGKDGTIQVIFNLKCTESDKTNAESK